MNTELEHRAWHIAGHAYAAAMCGFSVHKLALDGFSDADVEQRGTARRLDPWTMIRVPSWEGVIGGRDYVRVMEGLMSIALAGPCAELLHREMPCEISLVQQFAIDWDQAWKSAGFLWEEEPLRRSWLERWIHSSPAVIFHGTQEFYASVTTKLLEEGSMTGEEVQAAWNRLRAGHERSRTRRERQRRPVVLEPDDSECSGADFLTF
jgi:hypothetical protein